MTDVILAFRGRNSESITLGAAKMRGRANLDMNDTLCVASSVHSYSVHPIELDRILSQLVFLRSDTHEFHDDSAPLMFARMIVTYSTRRLG